VHHVGILYDQFMMHDQRNIKLVLTVEKLTLGEHALLSCYDVG